MEKEKLSNKKDNPVKENKTHVTIGRSSIPIEVLKPMKKDDFRKAFAGKLGVDIDKAWKIAQEARK